MYLVIGRNASLLHGHPQLVQGSVSWVLNDWQAFDGEKLDAVHCMLCYTALVCSLLLLRASYLFSLMRVIDASNSSP
jgi:hypothetical protein